MQRATGMQASTVGDEAPQMLLSTKLKEAIVLALNLKVSGPLSLHASEQTSYCLTAKGTDAAPPTHEHSDMLNHHHHKTPFDLTCALNTQTFIKFATCFK